MVSGRSDEKIKLIRAQGGCQGTIRRRRTWQAAKSHGEPQAGREPWISEWGNPAEVMFRHRKMKSYRRAPGELKHLSTRRKRKKTSISLVAASEGERGQTKGHAPWGCGPAESTQDFSGRGMESPARAGNSPVREKVERRAGTRVPQDTRNPAGSGEDHLPSLNTIW